METLLTEDFFEDLSIAGGADTDSPHVMLPQIVFHFNVEMLQWPEIQEWCPDSIVFLGILINWYFINSCWEKNAPVCIVLLCVAIFRNVTPTLNQDLMY